VCKVVCYIDGFNLYHGIDDLKKPHLKWVNLYDLANSLIYPNERLVAVNSFSAFATWKKHQYRRHLSYVKALEHVGVNCIISHFKKKPRSCRSCKASWMDHEEKETDVRLALKILEDAVDDVFDRAIIVSGDSDLVPVVQTIKRRYPKKNILIATPPKRFSASRDLRASAHKSKEITQGRIAKNLLPKDLQDGAGKLIVSRPERYDLPV